MSEFANLMSGGTQQLMQDPSVGAQTDLSSLLADPKLGGATAGIPSLLTSVQSHMSAELANMRVKLPMMSAVDGLQKRVGTCDGEFPGTDAGGTFEDAFASIKQLPDLLGDLYTQISDFLASAPPAPTGVPGQPAPANPNVAAVQAMVDAATSEFSSLASAAAAAYSTGMAQLQNFAFASFLSMPQPPAVQDILGRFVDVPPELKQEREVMAYSAPALQGSVTPVTYTLPNSETVARPSVAPQPKQMPPENKAKLKADLDAAKAAVDAAKITYDQSLANCQAWQEAHNYRQIKQAWRESNSQEAADAWHACKAQYEQDVYNHHLWEHANYALARSDYQTALNAYSGGLGV